MKQIITSLILLVSLLYSQEPKELPSIPPIQVQTPPPPQAIPPTNAETNTTTRNPFVPLITPQQSGQTPNAPELHLFTQTEIKLPTTARKLKKIILEYQNLDGSSTSIEQNIQGDIDWHFPLILSQQIQPDPIAKPTMQDFKLAKSFQIFAKEKTLQITTPFTLIRDFTLASPTRLILDFKNPTKTPLQDSFRIDLPIFTQATLQTHLDFYRITIMLDGQYNYSIQSHFAEKSNEYLIEFF